MVDIFHFGVTPYCQRPVFSLRLRWSNGGRGDREKGRRQLVSKATNSEELPPEHLVRFGARWDEQTMGSGEARWFGSSRRKKNKRRVHTMCGTTAWPRADHWRWRSNSGSASLRRIELFTCNKPDVTCMLGSTLVTSPPCAHQKPAPVHAFACPCATPRRRGRARPQ